MICSLGTNSSPCLNGPAPTRPDPAGRALTGFVLACLLSAGLSTAPALAGGLGELQPHRAVYEMSLGERGSSGFADAIGRIVIEISDACEGFIVDQRQRVELRTQDGMILPSDVNGSTWEGKDGRLYRFNVDRLEGIEAPSREVGRAVVDGEGRGLATYSVPEREPLALPRDVLFPSAHLAATLDAARAGLPFFAAPLFDGYEAKIYDVSAVIVPARPGDADAGRPFAELPSWRVRFAFFEHGMAEELPIYEISLRLYTNGVASEVSFDYGEFRLDGRLTEYQDLPRSDCQ